MRPVGSGQVGMDWAVRPWPAVMGMRSHSPCLPPAICLRPERDSTVAWRVVPVSPNHLPMELVDRCEFGSANPEVCSTFKTPGRIWARSMARCFLPVDHVERAARKTRLRMDPTPRTNEWRGEARIALTGVSVVTDDLFHRSGRLYRDDLP